MSHFSRRWWRHSIIMSLYHSQASKRDSPSICLNVVTWFISTFILLGGKYLAKKAFFSSLQVVIELAGRDYIQDLDLYLRIKENKHKWISSRFTLLVFNVSAYCTNTDIWRFGSSVGFPENWLCCTICSREGFNSKLFSWIAGGIILERGSSWGGTVKSLRGRSFGSAIRWNMTLSSRIRRLRWMNRSISGIDCVAVNLWPSSYG